jgi:hypothetical protein
MVCRGTFQDDQILIEGVGVLAHQALWMTLDDITFESGSDVPVLTSRLVCIG